jgi:vacuolar protein sorting-associated protein 26
LFYDRGNSYEFTSMVRELTSAGTIATATEYPFDFTAVEKKFESYSGINAQLRYFVRVTVTRSALYANVVQEFDFAVQNLTREPEINNTIKMEVCSPMSAGNLLAGN